MTTKPPTPTISLRDPARAAAPMVHITGNTTIMMLATKAPGLGEEKKHGNNRGRAANGKPTKFPSLASVSIDTPDVIHPNARRGRYGLRVDSAGRTIPFVHSCGAAHLVNVHGRFVTDPHARERLSKAWGLGWFSVEDDAACLLKQIADGECNPRRIVERSILTDEVCSGPCKHFAIEADARRAKHEQKMDKLEASFAGEDPSIAIARGVLAALKADRDAAPAKGKR